MRTSRGNTHDPSRQGHESGLHDGQHDAANGFNMADANTFGAEYKEDYVAGYNGRTASRQPRM